MSGLFASSRAIERIDGVWITSFFRFGTYPQDTPYFQNGVRTARLDRDVAHSPHYEDPDRFAGEVSDFIDTYAFRTRGR